jgi:3-hydroxyacyl-CoA dehydrogenase
MSDLVQLTQQDNIAIITINNPPVNALSPGVPEGISEAVDKISDDPSVKAAVLIGGGRTFVAGADIKEFGKMTSGIPRGAGLLPLLLKIEDCNKPIIVAIHGTAFGGGLELAMAGHYRVAEDSAQVGQPEVKLGIIPGAGGTQRLPRLAGVAKAVEMCTTGQPVKAAEALKFGIIDKLIDGDLLKGAIAFAQDVSSRPAPKTRERNEKLGTDSDNSVIFSAARDGIAKKQAGLRAPLAAIEAIEAATRFPFEEGCQIEQKLFMDCLFSDQSKALIHVFLVSAKSVKSLTSPKTPTSSP